MTLVETHNGILAKLQRMARSRTGAMATIQTLATNILILALNVLTGLITARSLGATGRGEQAAMVLWPPFFANVLTLGLPSAIIYNLKRNPEHRRELFSASLWLATVLGIAAAIVGMVVIPFQLTKYSHPVLIQAQWILWLTPTTLVALVLNGALQASDDFQVYNRVRYLSPLLTLAMLILLLVTHRLTPFSSSLAISIAGTPIFIWLLIRMVREYRPTIRISPRIYHNLLHYGVRSYGVDILNQLSLTLDQVLVVKFLPPRSMGLYVVALSLSRMLNVFQTSVVNVLFPKAAGRSTEEVVALTGQVMRISVLLTLAAAIVASIISPLLLEILYGRAFHEAVGVFRILVIEVVIGSAIAVLGQAFMALGRPGMVTLLQGVGVGLSLPLMIILIPRFGLVGAGLAILGSTTARLIFILLNYPLSLHVPPPSFLVSRADIHWLKSHLKR